MAALLQDLSRVAELMDEATSSKALFRMIPEQICRIFGFDRAIFCIIEGNWLKVKSAYFADDPGLASSLAQHAPEVILEEGIGNLQPRNTSDCAIVWRGTSEEHSKYRFICSEWLGAAQCVLVPVVVDRQAFGLIAAGWKEREISEPCGLLEAACIFSRLASHNISRLSAQENAVGAVERARQRVAELTLLSRLTADLRATSDVSDTLRTLIDQIHNVIDYDYGVAAVFDPDDKRWITVTRGPDDEPVPEFEQQIKGFHAETLAAYPPALLADLSFGAEPIAKLKLGMSRSHLFVPIKIGKSVFGFLALGDLSPSAFSSMDLRFAATAVETAVVIIENTRLYNRALRSEQRMREAFSQIGKVLSSGLDLESTLQVIVQLAAAMTEADGAAVFMINPEDRKTLVVRASYHLDEPYAVGSEVSAEGSLAARAVESRKMEIFSDVSGGNELVPVTIGGVASRSVISAPIILGGASAGVIEVYSRTPDFFKSATRELLEWFAGHAAIALGNAEAFQHQRNIAQTFQTSLLQVAKPEIPNLDIGVKYQAALEEAAIGGDFYDLIPMPDGRLGVVVCDVSGKGLKAATYTAMAKYMLRAYAVEQPSPASVLTRLNASFYRYAESGFFITLFYGVVDQQSRSIVCGSAGHEPPVLATKSSVRALNDMIGGLALGVAPDANYNEYSYKLEEESVFLLYTDGITEASRDGEFLGIDGVIELVRKYQDLRPSRMVEQIHRAVREFAGGRLRDDIVLLAIKCLGQPPC
ncbi:MAG: GAF domain-containing SpoIIE family protein phosphatase [Armatimonadota bacterium]